MYLSDLVEAVRDSIGDELDKDEHAEIDPRLTLHVNGMFIEVDQIYVDKLEIILSPRTS